MNPYNNSFYCMITNHEKTKQQYIQQAAPYVNSSLKHLPSSISKSFNPKKRSIIK